MVLKAIVLIRRHYKTALSSPLNGLEYIGHEGGSIMVFL